MKDIKNLKIARLFNIKSFIFVLCCLYSYNSFSMGRFISGAYQHFSKIKPQVIIKSAFGGRETTTSEPDLKNFPKSSNSNAIVVNFTAELFKIDLYDLAEVSIKRFNNKMNYICGADFRKIEEELSISQKSDLDINLNLDVVSATQFNDVILFKFVINIGDKFTSQPALFSHQMVFWDSGEWVPNPNDTVYSASYQINHIDFSRVKFEIKVSTLNKDNNRE